MRTYEIGEKLELEFYNYLLEQQNNSDLIFGIYPPDQCKIFHQKDYYCKEREGNIKFDVVVEVYRKGATQPHSLVIFECKNYQSSSVPEKDLTDLVDKIRRIGKCAAKGVLVTNTELQKGALSYARNNKIGIIKFNQEGTEIIADRLSNYTLSQTVKTDMQEGYGYSKNLKLSAYFSDKYFCEINTFIEAILHPESKDHTYKHHQSSPIIPFIKHDDLERHALELLDKTGYKYGKTDLNRICSHLNLNIIYHKHKLFNTEGNEVLGRACLSSKSISIFSHDDHLRKRFTLSHELAHFVLNHKDFIIRETVFNDDLKLNNSYNQNRILDALEYQANALASCILMPKDAFIKRVARILYDMDYHNKGFGFIYVDDQPWNKADYWRILHSLSEFFEASHQAIEIRLKKLNILNDKRFGSNDYLLKNSLPNTRP